MLNYKIHSKLREGVIMTEAVEDGEIVSSYIVEATKGCVNQLTDTESAIRQNPGLGSAFFYALKKHRYVGYGILMGLAAYVGIGDAMAVDPQNTLPNGKHISAANDKIKWLAGHMDTFVGQVVTAGVAGGMGYRFWKQSAVQGLFAGGMTWAVLDGVKTFLMSGGAGN